MCYTVKEAEKALQLLAGITPIDDKITHLEKLIKKQDKLLFDLNLEFAHVCKKSFSKEAKIMLDLCRIRQYYNFQKRGKPNN